MDIRSSFYTYRYLVSPSNTQMSLFDDKSKEDLMYDIIKNLALNTKTEWIKNSKRFLFYGYQNAENIFIIKFAKETQDKVYIEGDDDIEIHGITEAKYIYVIIDTEYQIILFENNTSAFQSIDSSASLFAKYLHEQMIKNNFSVNVYPLVSKKMFWKYVESAEKIYELSLTLNAPNMPLFGNVDTRAILQNIKDTTNNEEFNVSFKSKEGLLRITREALGGLIEYVREVGGRYRLKFKVNNVIDTKKSEMDTAKAYLSKKDKDKYNDEEIKYIKDKMQSLHTLDGREDDEN